MYYVGIDWADQKYDILIIDQNAQIVGKPMVIPKNQKGFDELLQQLRRLSADPQQIKIGIETPQNLLVDFLIDFNYPVFSIFPGSMPSFRKRFRASFARDDLFDAYVLAHVRRTDNDCWRPVDLGSDPIREIKILVRDHHLLIGDQTALTNRFRSTIKAYYPEYIHFFADVACPSSLAFLQAFPDFDSSSQLSFEQLIDFFKQQHYYQTKRIEKIFKRLHQPHIFVKPGVVRTRSLKALITAEQLTQIMHPLKRYETQIEQLFVEHPDHQIYLSYPGVGTILGARLLTMFGDNRQRYADVSELQAFVGSCPVTEKTGGDNTRLVYFRRAGDKFYRDTIYQLAFSSLTKAKWALNYYQEHRRRNHSHAHALRCLAHIHLRILFAMWKNRTEYDENHFLAQRARYYMQTKKI
jgi:hypothetical protein